MFKISENFEFLCSKFVKICENFEFLCSKLVKISENVDCKAKIMTGNTIGIEYWHYCIDIS